jgi:hypothetical protein
MIVQKETSVESSEWSFEWKKRADGLVDVAQYRGGWHVRTRVKSWNVERNVELCAT